MELIFILTYECNFRCKYCDINKRNEEISITNIEKSLNFLEKNNFDIKKVKFFGGEPLLKKDYIKKIILNFPKKYNPLFYVTTNSTIIDDDFIDFGEKNNLTITFSIDGDLDTISENRLLINGGNLSETIIKNTIKYKSSIRINQVITSKNSENFFNNFLYLYNLGVRKFNFLPEYYKEWSKSGLINLKKGFDQIIDFYDSNNYFEVINLENYSDISFFNLGIVIDTDGKVYGTNLILSGKFEKYKKELKIGDIFNGLDINMKDRIFLDNYIFKILEILKIEYSLNILKSVKYIDLILNNFCNNIK